MPNKRKQTSSGSTPTAKSKRQSDEAGSVALSGAGQQQPPTVGTPVSRSGITPPVSFSMQSGAVASRSVRSVPDVVAVTPSDQRSAGTSDADWYDQCRKKGLRGSDAMLECDLVVYVRAELFPKLKFIMDPRQLVYSTAKTSICLQICKDMGLKDSRAAQWWELYKNKINSTLNQKRADVTSAIRRTFLSK